MRPPLWIINSALVAMLFLCIYLVLIIQPQAAPAVSLAPKSITESNTSIAPVNLKSIYEDDIFKTHISNINVEIDHSINLQVPMPPDYLPLNIEQPELPSFIEPLPIIITGIIAIGEESQNRAMIKNTNDQTERAYSVGDNLEDAQIIKILPQKIMIVRKNSQQETLFLREQDALSDLENIDVDWPAAIINEGENQYKINCKIFSEQIKNLGNFVDLLNLITAYKAGISIGVKVGSNATSPLVNQLGLFSGDIITTINDINISDINGRMLAYHLISAQQTNRLKIQVIRAAQELELTYNLLDDLTDKDKIVTANNNAAAVKAHVTKHQSTFENIHDKIKNNDRKHVAQFKNKISQSVSR